MAPRILVAFDESPQASAALRHALSTYPDAEIRVLHVNDPRDWAGGASVGEGYYPEAAYEQSKEAAERLLEKAEETAREHDVNVTTEAVMGFAAPTIVEYAEDHDVDHVVLGSHARRGLARFLLGSVAKRVAKRSPTSVTIIREPNEGGADET